MKRKNTMVRRYSHFTALALRILVTGCCLSAGLFASAQEDSLNSPANLKQLSLEDLMNIEVTLVSRSPERLSVAASAVQVISGADIVRSGAVNIPQALRLFTNLQVAQLNSNSWIISSRGFNTVFANKLLVMIDGRTVYTPLFGGVIWDLQGVMIEDIDRIEVVSGPGATLWGANAVNGVINIVTKKTSETQGLYVSAAGGSFIQDEAVLRYGGKIGKDVTYKLYGQRLDYDPTFTAAGKENTDRWGKTQAGFRVDWNASVKDAYTIQGDLYKGTNHTAGGNSDFNGQNLLTRWSHNFSPKSDITLQLYFDRYYRTDKPSQGADKMLTYDLDFQHRLPLGKQQQLLWGVGYRAVKDEAVYTTNLVGILPPRKNLDLVNIFVQDEITLQPQLKFTIGSKLLHNVYTGIELQPSARLAWNVSSKMMLWTAVSRAVRTPSRLDVDYFLPAYTVTPGTPNVAGGPNFVSEKLVAYELGARLQAGNNCTFSASTFYNVYQDLYSVEALPNSVTYQIQNGSQGKSWGLEFAGTCQLSNKWRLRGGYTYFDKKLVAKPGRNFDPTYLANDVKNQVMLQSILDIGRHFHFDIAARYLDRISKTLATSRVPAYCCFDGRLAYSFGKAEFAVVGQNLVNKRHSEYDILQIPSSVYAKIIVRL